MNDREKTPRAKVTLQPDGSYAIVCGDLSARAMGAKALATLLAHWMQECWASRRELSEARTVIGKLVDGIVAIRDNHSVAYKHRQGTTTRTCEELLQVAKQGGRGAER